MAVKTKYPGPRPLKELPKDYDPGKHLILTPADFGPKYVYRYWEYRAQRMEDSLRFHKLLCVIAEKVREQARFTPMLFIQHCGQIFQLIRFQEKMELTKSGKFDAKEWDREQRAFESLLESTISELYDLNGSTPKATRRMLKGMTSLLEEVEAATPFKKNEENKYIQPTSKPVPADPLPADAEAIRDNLVNMLEAAKQKGNWPEQQPAKPKLPGS